MSASRVPAERGAPIEFEFEGEPVGSYEGETVAAALLAAGVPAFGVTREGDARLPLCNMGTCYDCAVTADGERLVRACLADARPGMVVERNEAS
ncbi:(2Fe-2S)-binding protein [Leucobacter chromiisoli]|uniref:(2Fe-2S)-binding protein n=1 Tax=Leucobacter chromiisoli TaxID=2796471 RepID=UPI0027DD6E45|nr:(2Fe-2S)-binding protein [Leucobacter chromiisoli]